jgi:hypothetical protein
MPWSVSDVDSHKKGLTPEQKKKWVSIANGIYKECLSKGGTDKTCAPKAIRIANSKFSEEPIMQIETLKISKKALEFTDHDSFAKVTPKEDGKSRGLKMVGYSGKIIKNHWYWGNLAIDTAGISMAKKVLPVLQDHETDRKIGFGSFVINEKHEVVSGDFTFVDTPHAAEFIKLSDQGFPYEASIQARPVKIQRLTEDEETEVNGYRMKGPGTVWRESVLKESSVCTFGADANTKSVAMTEDEEVDVEVTQMKEKTNQEEEVVMDLTKLKTEHPDLFNQVVAVGKQEAETAFAVERTGLQNQITQLTAERTQLSAQNADTSARLLKLEKQDTVRRETELRMSADAIFSAKLSAANIPERLHAKVKKQIDYGKFVKDDVLDVTAFKTAIDTELKDWTPTEGEESVLGMSFGRKPEGNSDSEDVIVDRMLAHTGQKATQH